MSFYFVKKNKPTKTDNKEKIDLCSTDKDVLPSSDEDRLPVIVSIVASASTATATATATDVDALMEDTVLIFPGRSVCFIIRGKPLVQERDKPGYNGTRFNPSKVAHNAFHTEATRLVFKWNGGDKFRFGDTDSLVFKIEFRFPLPENGKNHGDLDNLLKFVLDSLQDSTTKRKKTGVTKKTLRKIFFKNDLKVIRIIADKGFGAGYGSKGYTKVEISSTKV